MPMLKLLLIDDHLLVRTGFKSLLLTFENCSVVAEASCGEDALALYKQHSPDIVILEIDMPGMGGIETMKRILDKYPKAKIIVLTVHEEIIYVKRALALGALGDIATDHRECFFCDDGSQRFFGHAVSHHFGSMVGVTQKMAMAGAGFAICAKCFDDGFVTKI